MVAVIKENTCVRNVFKKKGRRNQSKELNGVWKSAHEEQVGERVEAADRVGEEEHLDGAALVFAHRLLLHVSDACVSQQCQRDYHDAYTTQKITQVEHMREGTFRAM